MSRKPGDAHLRRFGIMTAVALSLLATILLWKAIVYYPYVYALAGLIMLSAIIFPRLLKPVEILSSIIMRIFGIIVGAIALTLVYYIILTPTALVLRIFRQKPLDIDLDPDAASYWKPVDRNGSLSRHDKPF